ncbi:MAG: carbamoyl phosphate synthase small subunit [Bacteroidales bacterium]|nr:carbamoyl phosphate synthase small subunit [Clostridium sp.]MCM1203873.1 carbamoyl phosphate synthase small subunit [Bacteroidales bacterium]
MKAFLILEDGHVFEGKSVGCTEEIISEIVFNTSMTGYLEVLTDPSYAGQAVCMTYPLIGNYGVCFEDMEASKPWQSGFITREIARLPSNFRNQEALSDFLIANRITGIEGVDTRAITKLLREKGTMRGMITTDEQFNPDSVIPRLKNYEIGDVVALTTCKEPEHYAGGGYKVAVLDLGAKKNIIRELTGRECEVFVYPSFTKAEDILACSPDGIMLTNGPGDPKTNTGIIEEIKKLFATKIPIFAICLGHQLLALANGADTEKMKYGHRGANHPVKDLKTGKVYISTQNHGYMVKEATIDRDIAEVSFINVNDGTVEGIHYLGKNVQTVQFHPEACAGPLDTNYLFDEFMNMMEVSK